jgi:hypothetical protein
LLAKEELGYDGPQEEQVEARWVVLLDGKKGARTT